jgi:uncharacterized protein (DUF302 family)
MERLESQISAKGMEVFARIDHAAEAGLYLRPTDLIIFVNARACTPLMQSSQTVGIDLPLKALVWQDKAGNTGLSYNGTIIFFKFPRKGLNWIVQRRGLAADAEDNQKMAAALIAISTKVANP